MKRRSGKPSCVRRCACNTEPTRGISPSERAADVDSSSAMFCARACEDRRLQHTQCRPWERGRRALTTARQPCHPHRQLRAILRASSHLLRTLVASAVRHVTVLTYASNLVDPTRAPHNRRAYLHERARERPSPAAPAPRLRESVGHSPQQRKSRQKSLNPCAVFSSLPALRLY